MSKVTLTNLANLQNETTAVNAINNNNTALTNAIENTLSRDGTSPNIMSSSLDMNSNQIINLPAPTSQASPVRLQDMTDFSGGGTINLTGAPTSATYVTLSSNASLTSERILTAGGGVTITDNGANGTVVISANTNSSVDDATNNGVSTAFTTTHTTTGTPAIGIGTGLGFITECTGGNRTGSRIDSVSTDVTNGSENFDVVINSMFDGTLQKVFTFTPTAVSATGSLLAAPGAFLMTANGVGTYDFQVQASDDIIFQPNGGNGDGTGKLEVNGSQYNLLSSLNATCVSNSGSDPAMNIAYAPTRAFEAHDYNATTNAVRYPLRISKFTSGTAANGLGTGIEFETQTGVATYKVGATIESVSTDVTAASEDFDLSIKLMAAGAAAAQVLLLKGTGSLQHSDGTVSLPGMSFISDTNTGIYRIGSDSLGITANGVLLATFANATGVTVATGFNFTADTHIANTSFVGTPHIGASSGAGGVEIRTTSGNSTAGTIRFTYGNNGATEIARFGFGSAVAGLSINSTTITDNFLRFGSGPSTGSGFLVDASAAGVNGTGCSFGAGASGSGTNLNGGFISFAAASGTGNGINSDVYFYTYLPAASGTGAQTLSETLFLNRGNTVVGNTGSALAATATNSSDGFIYLPSCAGTPTGTPTAYTGKVAHIYDTTNNKLYVYNGGWKATAALT